MKSRPEEVRAPGAENPQTEMVPDVPVEYQPESGAIGPHEAAPAGDDGADPGDDL
jgi:hypothetical protein